MKTCKDCSFFKRARWHKMIDPKEEEQLGGNCEMLTRILSLSNTSFNLCFGNDLYVFESFGCIGFREKE